jgi:hypothetical protein
MRFFSDCESRLLASLLFITAAATCQPVPSPSRNMDGPAELPRAYVSSAVAETPATGSIWQIKTSDQLQDALKNAKCGDVLKLQAGATFAGPFHLGPKSCDDQHWIIIRTSTEDSLLPPEGTRLTPCHAGVSSLPARPALHCASTQVVTAQIVGNPPFNSEGAPIDHYRLMGLEITHPSGTDAGALVGLAVNSHHIILDRCWIHGNARDGTQRAIALNGSNLAVVDSTITDIHQVNTDTQGIAGWTGTGPLKIVDNFIEGGSSSIGFGGAGSEITPRDIEIRRNHLFKPFTWRLGDPNFLGVRFNCKVLFESKNSSRVLLEGNIFENSWGGPQGGDGDAIWLGPKNQNNRCPSCEVNDITFRYNIIRHAGGGLYIFDSPSDAGGIARQASRYSIHDNLLDDIRTEYAGPGAGRGILFRLLGGPRFQPPRDIDIEHNTGITNGQMLQLLTTRQAPLVGLRFENNLIVMTGGVVISGCQGVYGGAVLDMCALDLVFLNNAIAGSDGDFPKSNNKIRKRKDVNLRPKDPSLIRFAAAQNGDYRLCRGAGDPVPSCAQPSPYSGAASDEKDLGADLEKVNQLTQDLD